MAQISAQRIVVEATIFYCNYCYDELHCLCMTAIKNTNVCADCIETQKFPEFFKRADSSLCIVCLVCNHNAVLIQQFVQQIDQKKTRLLDRAFFGVGVSVDNFNIRGDVVQLFDENHIQNLAERVSSYIENNKTCLSVYHTNVGDVRRRSQKVSRRNTKRRRETFSNLEENNPTGSDPDETSAKRPVHVPKQGDIRARHLNKTRDSRNINYEQLHNGNPDGYQDDYVLDGSMYEEPDSLPNNTTQSLDTYADAEEDIIEELTVQPCDQFIESHSRLPSITGRGTQVLDRLIFPNAEYMFTDKLVERFNISDGEEKEEMASFILNIHIPRLTQIMATDAIAELLSIRSYSRITNVVLDVLQKQLLALDYNTDATDVLVRAMGIVLKELATSLGDIESVKSLTFILTVMLCRLYLLYLSQSREMATRGHRDKDMLQWMYRELDDLLGIFSKPCITSSFILCTKYFVKQLIERLHSKSSMMMWDWQKVLIETSVREEFLKAMADMDFVEVTACNILCVCLVKSTFDRSNISIQLLKSAAKFGLDAYKKIGKKEKAKMNQFKGFFRFFHVRSISVLFQQLQDPSVTFSLTEYAKNELLNMVDFLIDSKGHHKGVHIEDIRHLTIHSDDTVKTRSIEIMHKHGLVDDLDMDKYYLEHTLRNARLFVHDQGKRNTLTQHWKQYDGKLGNVDVKVKYRVPTVDCLAVGLLGKEDALQTEFNKNTMQILKRIQREGTQPNIVAMLFYNEAPSPLFYGIQIGDRENLLEVLLNRRKHKDWCSQRELYLLLRDAASALRYLHVRKILHRDITSCRFMVRRDMSDLKLANFRISKYCPIEKGTILPGDADKIAVRWSSKETLKMDEYSTASDMWMLGLFSWEVLTHGCWPFSEHINHETDDIMVMVVMQGLNPCQPTFIEDQMFHLILRCLERDTNRRITAQQFEEELTEIINENIELQDVVYDELSPLTKGPSEIWFKQQGKITGGLPELGVPSVVRQLKYNETIPYDNLRSRIIEHAVLPQQSDIQDKHYEPHIENLQSETGCRGLRVTEQLSEDAKKFMLPGFKELYGITGLNENCLYRHFEEDTQYIVHKYLEDGDILLNKALTDLRRSDQASMQKTYLKIMKQVAKTINVYHNNRWIVRCLTARDIWLTSNEKKVQFMRLTRTCPLPQDEEYVTTSFFQDRLNWCPLEVLRDGQFSKKSDVYMFAAVAYEVFKALSLHQNDPTKQDLYCIPFANIGWNTKQLQECLLNGEVPDRPDLCPPLMYDLMCECWNRDCIRRPSISKVIDRLDTILQQEITALPDGDSSFSSTGWEEANPRALSDYRHFKQSNVQGKPVTSFGINRRGIVFDLIGDRPTGSQNSARERTRFNISRTTSLRQKESNYHNHHKKQNNTVTSRWLLNKGRGSIQDTYHEEQEENDHHIDGHARQMKFRPTKSFGGAQLLGSSGEFGTFNKHDKFGTPSSSSFFQRRQKHDVRSRSNGISSASRQKSSEMRGNIGTKFSILKQSSYAQRQRKAQVERTLKGQRLQQKMHTGEEEKVSKVHWKSDSKLNEEHILITSSSSRSLTAEAPTVDMSNNEAHRSTGRKGKERTVLKRETEECDSVREAEIIVHNDADKALTTCNMEKNNFANSPESSTSGDLGQVFHSKSQIKSFQNQSTMKTTGHGFPQASDIENESVKPKLQNKTDPRLDSIAQCSFVNSSPESSASACLRDYMKAKVLDAERQTSETKTTALVFANESSSGSSASGNSHFQTSNISSTHSSNSEYINADSHHQQMRHYLHAPAFNNTGQQYDQSSRVSNIYSYEQHHSPVRVNHRHETKINEGYDFHTNMVANRHSSIDTAYSENPFQQDHNWNDISSRAGNFILRERIPRRSEEAITDDSSSEIYANQAFVDDDQVSVDGDGNTKLLYY